MTTNGIVGAVAGLWRFAVKSMRGERLEQAELTEHGLVSDRAYALIGGHRQGGEREEREAVSRPIRL